MNILICHRPEGAFGFISDGWINALRDAGLNAIRWDGMPSTWFKFQPDLYIGCSGHKQPLPSRFNRKHTKVAIHVNPHGPVDIKPSINESKNTVTWVQSVDPDIVFGYGFEKDRNYWSAWPKTISCNWTPLPTAGDATYYTQADALKKHNIAYVGGYWPYKSQNIDAFLVPVIKRMKCEVKGWGKWPVLKVRECTTSDKLSLLQSTRIGPCIVEPHTTTYGIDLPERVFKVILCGAIAVHDKVIDGSKILKSVKWCDNASAYLNEINNVLKMDASAQYEIWLSQFQEVIANHTYHHRMAHLLSVLGFANEAKNVLDCLQKYQSIKQTSKCF